MKWIAIAGGWRKTNEEVEKDVRKTTRAIISRGDGIVSGGALGVDFIATDEALKSNCNSGQLKILIPSTLKIYEEHYFHRAEEGVVTKEQAEELIGQLKKVKAVGALVEGTDKVLNKETYFNRISKIVEGADELIAFDINKTEGTNDTIEKAKKKGIPTRIFSYSI